MIRQSAPLLTLIVLLSAAILAAQEPPPQGGGRGGRQGGAGRGANFPQQQRALADTAVLARGKGLFDANCSACHGIDLRGGQQGGPNLLRSQIVLLDKAGEGIGAVLKEGRPRPTQASATPMPPFTLPPEDVQAIAEYIHSVAAQAGRQGRPPVDENVPPEKILVGDAASGKAYFEATCSRCHSVDGDLKGIAARAADPRELQNTWVSGAGGGRGGRGGRGGGARASATVTPASGAPVTGRLLRVDDFIVSLQLEDGSRRTFVRNGSDPKVDIQDPAEAHRRLVTALADKDMHDVTAYLWSLK